MVHPSAIKRHRQSERRRVRNRAARSQVRGAIKQVRQAVDAANVSDATAKLQVAERLLTKAVTRRVLHRNTASRYLSRLSRQVNGIRSA